MSERDDEIERLYAPVDVASQARTRRLFVAAAVCVVLAATGAYLVMQLGFDGMRPVDPRDRAFEDRR